jgi:uncharacterized membrane protein
LPVARTWHAHTSPNPPFPKTLYIRKVFLVTGSLLKKEIFILKDKKKTKNKNKNKKTFCSTFCSVSIISRIYTCTWFI